MEKSITKNLMAIVMRGGLEIWIEEEKIQNLKRALMSGKESKFIELNDEVINSADIVGIFTPQTMENKIRQKNGQWKCSEGVWHDKYEKCECNIEIPKYARKWSIEGQLNKLC